MDHKHHHSANAVVNVKLHRRTEKHHVYSTVKISSGQKAKKSILAHSSEPTAFQILDSAGQEFPVAVFEYGHSATVHFEHLHSEQYKDF